MDPRQGKYMYSGFEFFLQETEAELIFPMHMWQDYSGIGRFKGKLANPRMADRIMDIESENQEFYIGES